MDLINCENISYCTVFDLRLTQDELEVYESCMKYILDNCDNDKIKEITGCNLDEYSAWYKELRNLIVSYVHEGNLPDKYRK
ncbi:MAG: hypothetical protein AB6733_15205 [Clostridiaceae bacterium]